MKRLLWISPLLVLASAAPAGDTAHCDAKPFTLNKPRPAAAPKPAGTSTADAASAKPATPKATPKTSANPAKPKPFADCKGPAPKKG
jgi:hypothetical protein